MQNITLVPMADVIYSVLPPNVSFKPNIGFYNEIGINKHRFAKIMKGEIDPTRTELHAISKYFKIPSNQLV